MTLFTANIANTLLSDAFCCMLSYIHTQFQYLSMTYGIHCSGYIFSIFVILCGEPEGFEKVIVYTDVFDFPPSEQNESRL